MLELIPRDYALIGEIVRQFGSLLPLAVVEGSNPGWVWADSLSRPRLAAIGLACGYFFIGGDPAAADWPGLAELLAELVRRSLAAGNAGFILSFSSSAWEGGLGALLPGAAPLRIYRRRFRFDPARFALAEAALPPLLPGCDLARIDSQALAAFPALAGEIAQTWASPADFLERGLGICLTCQGELASWCLSPFAAHWALEISVCTRESLRRQGFALRCAAAFVRACLQAGIRPNWECFWDNLPSNRLAQALGFEETGDLPVFYWEVPPPRLL